MFYPLEPLPRWFRVMGLANPITWQVDLLRYGTIGLGDPHRLALEALAFALFVAGCFAYAARSLNQES
jgi:ABC-type multidrug transport system permease subunit